MTDAISRSAAMNALSRVFGIPLDYDGNCDETCDEAFAAIEALLSLDVVPVVRCVDCKHRCTFVCPMYHTETCLDDLDGFDDYEVDRTDDDGFCHLGERWEGEADE